MPKREMNKSIQLGISSIGQSFLEYALLIAVIVAAFVSMYSFFQRTTNANLKLIEEKVNQEEKVRYTIRGLPWLKVETIQ